MRKYFGAALAVLLCAALLTGCAGGNIGEMSSLYEFSRPYAGEYECETLTLAGEDMLSSFEYVRLALSYGGQARFFWRSAQGGEGEYTLDYLADVQEGRIAFCARTRGAAAHAFPLEKGSVRLGISLGGRYLYAVFTQ